MQTQYIVQTRSSAINKEQFAIHLAFFLLFPGFFFYQTLLGIGTISAFLGGYFSIISLLFILPFIFFYLGKARREKNYFSNIDLYFSIYLAYFLFVVTINFFAGANQQIVRDHILSIIYFVNMFVMFKMIDIDDKQFQAVTTMSLIMMSAIIFYFSVDGSFYLASLNESRNPESLATYQGFARSYMFTLVVMMCFVKSVPARMLMYAIAIPALFINTARSEFVAILFLIPIIELYYAKHKLLMVLAMLVIFSIAAFGYTYVSAAFPDNRVLELTDISQSSSGILRHYLTVQALKTIADNPILGDYASYPVGSYAHNILSAWVDLGLFGFVFLLAILIFPALRMLFDGVFLRTKSKHFILAFSLMSITLLMLFTSKNFTDIPIGAALGAYANYRRGKKYA